MVSILINGACGKKMCIRDRLGRPRQGGRRHPHAGGRPALHRPGRVPHRLDRERAHRRCVPRKVRRITPKANVPRASMRSAGDVCLVQSVGAVHRHLDLLVLRVQGVNPDRQNVAAGGRCALHRPGCVPHRRCVPRKIRRVTPKAKGPPRFHAKRGGLFPRPISRGGASSPGDVYKRQRASCASRTTAG